MTKLIFSQINFIFVLFCSLLLFTQCVKKSDLIAEVDSQISYFNGSALLQAQLTSDDKKGAYIFWDVLDTTIVPNTEQGFTNLTNVPVFSGANYLLSIYTYPAAPAAGPGSEDVVSGSAYYMRTPAILHHALLKDTSLKTVLLHTVTTGSDHPTSVFYADSLGKFSAVAVKDVWAENEDGINLRVVDLSPDPDTRILRINKMPVAGIPDSLNYRTVTSFQQLQGTIPNNILNIRLYSKSDTANAIARGTVTVQPGHSYTLTIYGYQNPQYYPLPDNNSLFINSKLVLDVRKNH